MKDDCEMCAEYKVDAIVDYEGCEYNVCAYCHEKYWPEMFEAELQMLEDGVVDPPKEYTNNVIYVDFKAKKRIYPQAA